MSSVRRGRRAAGGFMRDFREFALKGSVVDLAIGVIIGAAFGKIITSVVEDLIMPLINPLMGGENDAWRQITIPPGLKIGSFLGAVVDFAIIAFVLFLIIRALAKFKRKEEAIAAEEAPADPVILAQERLTDAIERLRQTLESPNNLS